MNIDYSNISSIELCDLYEDMYSSKLSYLFSTDEVSTFLESVSSITESDVPSGSRAYYQLKLRDGNNDIIDIWTIDSYASITSLNGKNFVRNGEIDALLTSIEKKNKLSLDSVYGRSPGTNYFYMLQYAKTAEIDEMTETNFDNGIELELSEIEISDFTDCVQKEKFSKKAKKIDDYKYVVEFFSENEASLYIFYVDKEWKVFTEYGYELTEGEVSKYIKEIIQNLK